MTIAFPNNRLNTKVSDTGIILSAEITNKYGKSCSEPINEKLPQTMSQATTELPVSITSNCANPKLSLTLSDQDGNILDQKEFNVDSTTIPDSKGLSTNAIIIIIIVVLLIILLGFYFKKKGNSPNNSDSNLGGPTGDNNNVVAGVLFLIALIGLASFGFNKVEKVIAAGGSDLPPVSLVINTDRDVYFVGDSITASATANLGMCANAVSVFRLYVSIDGGYDFLIADSNAADSTIYGSHIFTGNRTPGTHYVNFTVEVDGGSVRKNKSITVLPKPTVKTYVNGEESTIVPVGGSAKITWEATNATIGCSCTLSPATIDLATGDEITSCGESLANENNSGDNIVTNITKPTTASVKCSSSDYALPSSTTTFTTTSDFLPEQVDSHPL